MRRTKISYDNIEELIGSIWKFNQSDGCEVKLISVTKALSKTTGKVITFKHLTYSKPDFQTNEQNFRKDILIWADKIK